MYVAGNPKSKAELRRWIKEGKKLKVYSPGMGICTHTSATHAWLRRTGHLQKPINGTVTIEGPHYPQPHSWYGVATIKDGVVVKVK